MYKNVKYILNKISIYTFGVGRAKLIPAHSPFQDWEDPLEIEWGKGGSCEWVVFSFLPSLDLRGLLIY